MEAKENLSSVLIWKQRSARSADFQSAVSPNCIRQGAENPRYGRLKICATMTTSPPQIKALPKSRFSIIFGAWLAGKDEQNEFELV
jgi:hypothetical protein